MSALRSVKQGLSRFWGMAEDDGYEDEDQPQRTHSQDAQSDEEEDDQDDAPRERVETRTETQTIYAPSSSLRGRRQSDDSGDSAQSEPQPVHISPRAQESAPPPRGPGGRGLRSVALPVRAREKNIYTLKPKSMDEASLAADYLKTGCAVVVNLEEVERFVAIRIIDFMSGVCYGLEHQGHAMKLGDLIFLFTPGDFEISSDEVDYGENRDFIFKDVAPGAEASPGEPGAGGRRSWER